MKREFNLFEKWMLIGSVLAIIAANLNFTTVRYLDGGSSKCGSIIDYGGFFFLVPVIAVVVFVILNLDQLSLVSSIIFLVLSVYLCFILNTGAMSTDFSKVVKGIGWYIWIIATIFIVAGAVLNFKSKKN